MGAAPSFTSVFRQEYGYVVSSLRRLGVGVGDMEDVAQDVFLTIHAILGDYDPTRPLRPWLFGIAYRHALRHRDRARHRREQLTADPGSDIAAPRGDEPHHAAVQHEAQDLVLAALQRVEVSRRAVFVMACIDGYTAPEIAEALSIPVNTAYSRLRLAREEFTKAARSLSAQPGGAA